MTVRDIRGKFIKGVFWKFAERWSTQAVQFCVSMVLARLLMPEDYGVVAIVNVFTAIASVFVEGGMTKALIQKSETDEMDMSTVFYFNVTMGMFFYFILFFAAPVIAKIYGDPELIALVRVLGLGLPISGFASVQHALISRRMEFRRFFFSSAAGTMVSAVLGIVMALMGKGAWALVGQHLSNLAIDTLMLWLMMRWVPRGTFSFERFRKLFSFGGRILLSTVINTFYENCFSLIVGKAYSLGDLAYYNRGNTIPSLMTVNLNASIQSVALPAFSAAQDDRDRLRSMVRRAVTVSAYLMLPAMAGLAVTARDIICIVFTEKWLPAVIFMQFSCFVYALWPMHTSNLEAIAACGRSDIYLKQEILKTAIGITVLVSTVGISISAMMAGTAVYCVLSWIINAFPNKRLIGYGFLNQLRDIVPIGLITAVMALSVMAVSSIDINRPLSLILQIMTGAAVYTFLSAAFKISSFVYILDTAKELIKRKRDRLYGV